MRLKDKSSIVTGAASGIGRAIALLFAREGSIVTVADVNESGGQETVRLIREMGREALFCRVDVSNSREVQRMVDETVRKAWQDKHPRKRRGAYERLRNRSRNHRRAVG